MGMSFVVDGGVVLEMHWSQMAWISIAGPGTYITQIALSGDNVLKQVRSGISQIENLKNQLNESELE